MNKMFIVFKIIFLTVLCQSVPVKDREICLETVDKGECLRDNCCFDETAKPGSQCFFKPSSPG